MSRVRGWFLCLAGPYEFLGHRPEREAWSRAPILRESKTRPPSEDGNRAT
jgi:hypothetical protein